MASTLRENANEWTARASHLSAYASKLPSAALRYLVIRSTVDVLVIGTFTCILVLMLVPRDWSVPSLAATGILISAGLIIDVPIISRLTMRHTSYEVDSNAVRVKRGILFSKDTVLSTAQILNVSIVEGPLMRRYGLAKVKFITLNHVEPLGPVELAVANEIRRLTLSVYLEASTSGK
ncbi:PH domain-containing protein [Paenarthrobacter sp. NPDC089989]|uniref:PH domain-containing protein n=1 Tax=unclassified Paenarthrobacter TaxID=2634190 RepID=UPI00382AA2F2